MNAFRPGRAISSLLAVMIAAFKMMLPFAFPLMMTSYSRACFGQDSRLRLIDLME
jgi:hypothetical protein